MRITVMIKDEDGHEKEAIPVRALPFMVPALTPLRIATNLNVISLGAMLSLDEGPLLQGIRAYHLEDGRPVEIPSARWNRYEHAIAQWEAEHGPDDAEYRNTIAMLPAGVFIWKQDFEFHFEGRTPAPPGAEAPRPLRTAWDDPLIAGDMKAVVMQGFESCRPVWRSRHIVILIDSREAIPVRAILFALKRQHPMAVVRDLARIGQADFPISPPIRVQVLMTDGGIAEFLTLNWQELEGRWENQKLERLKNRCDAPPPKKQSRLDQLRALPPGVFLWRDDFERAFNKVLSGYPPGKLKLTLTGFDYDYDPEMDEETYTVVMEGMGQWLSPTNEGTLSAITAALPPDGGTPGPDHAGDTPRGLIPVRQPERRKDDWPNVILDAIRTFEREHGYTANKVQLWQQLLKNPPDGYHVQWDDRDKSLRMPDNPSLNRAGFADRFDRLYQDDKPR